MILDQADVFSLQNWEHAKVLFAAVNSIPYKQHDVDISRLRMWYLNGWAKYYRQTIVLSNYMNVDLNNWFRQSVNYTGRIFLKATYKDVLSRVIPTVRQLFQRITCTEIGRAVQQECRDRSRMPSSA
eukprot:TRINITY_DN11637_c0_g2_i2.p1 TRINITY_DN11637_c0_g2~~TRINITY_DN11637_c0_g2_i2.p1  ORF type:complete len:127 (-),score=12.18 TRINITY_DN11637_c0_g2_i2:11-391(-)